MPQWRPSKLILLEVDGRHMRSLETAAISRNPGQDGTDAADVHAVPSQPNPIRVGDLGVRRLRESQTPSEGRRGRQTLDAEKLRGRQTALRSG